MNERELEKRIKSMMEKNTPDDLEEILKACHIDAEEAHHHHDTVVPFGAEAKRKNRIYRMVGSLAAAFVIFIAGFMIVNGENAKVAAIVGLDVNPSIELSVNKEGKVLDAASVNKDGEKILDGMELKGTQIDVAANAILGSMVKNGYLNEISNSILVSVQAEDEALGSRMESEISKSINDYLETSAIGGAILGQYVAGSDEVKAFAEENGISVGKAALIKAMSNGDGRLDEKSLLKISTQELLMIANDRKISSGYGSYYGEVDSRGYISKEKALDIAMKRAGVSDKDVDSYSIEFECDEGQITYEVELICGNAEYEAELDACVGTVLEFHKEGTEKKVEAGGKISYEDAKRIALRKAGVSADDITEFEAEIDDGQYELEFDYNNIEIEVDIDINTGEVVHFRKEYDDR